MSHHSATCHAVSTRPIYACHGVATRPIYGLLFGLLFISFTSSAQILLTDANPNTDRPTLYELTTVHDDQSQKYLLFFPTRKSARTWATIAGYTAITAGGILGGNAERIRMYEGTRSNWDAFHLQRDAGLILTGIGSASLGASIAVGEKPRWREVIWKTLSGAILYRITAQCTYNITKPK